MVCIYTGPSKECPTSSEREETCIILHSSARNRGYKLGERGSDSQVSLCVCEWIVLFVSVVNMVCARAPLDMASTPPYYIVVPIKSESMYPYLLEVWHDVV